MDITINTLRRIPKNFKYFPNVLRDCTYKKKRKRRKKIQKQQERERERQREKTKQKDPEQKDSNEYF